MRKTLIILSGLLIIAVLILLSPLIFFVILGVVGRVEYTIQKTIEDRAVEKASLSIEQFEVEDKKYDIMAIVVRISNTEIEYEQKDSRLEISNFQYKMGSSIFNNFSTHGMYSYNKEENDIQFINDICKVLNQYDLDYNYVDGYSYRGFYYEEGYLFGRYDESFLNGQFIEISLRPIEGQNIILRFDLELSPDSVEYQIVQDLRAIENARDEYSVSSFYNLLGLINREQQENTD